MSKFVEHFYIFSKLTTSLFLILVISFLTYALFVSYKDVEKVSLNEQNDLNSLSEMISSNDKKLLNLDNQFNIISGTIKEIEKLILENNKDKNTATSSNEKNIKSLIKLNQELQKQLSNLKFFKKNSPENPEPSNLSNKLNQIEPLIDFILIKYKKGDPILEELAILEKLLPSKRSNIFEKLYTLQHNKFYGLVNLQKEFDLSMNKFVENKYKNQNNNLIMNFIFKFVSIKPGNLQIYNHTDLNTLMEASKLLNENNIKDSLSAIFLIDKNKKFFSKYIDQAKIYIEFENEILKVL